MNTETNQNRTAVGTTGERLRSAREAIGLSQQNVADKLCLKLSTVRDIEEDTAPPELAATFLRGYIRSYARLVHLPEEELLPALTKQVPLRTTHVTPMQHYSLKSRRYTKKRDGLLKAVTWLIFIVVMGLTVLWWWQNHKSAEQITPSTSVTSDTGDASSASSDQSIPLSINNAEHQAAPSEVDDGSATSSANPTIPTPATSEKNTHGTAVAPVPTNSLVNATSETQQSVAPANAMPAATPASNSAESAVAANSSQTDNLVINFTANCWLEVTDAAGKKLFSGLQHGGATLNLQGQHPYKLKIGAPSAVTIQFRGQPVDLSRFARSSQVARLSVGEH